MHLRIRKIHIWYIQQTTSTLFSTGIHVNTTGLHVLLPTSKLTPSESKNTCFHYYYLKQCLTFQLKGAKSRRTILLESRA